MSKIGYKGATFRILRDGEILAAVRTKSAAHVRNVIDRTDEERDGWRHLDRRYESIAVEISAEGVATAANYALLEQDWLGDTFTDLVLAFPDGSIELAEDGAFLNSLTFGGEFRGAVSFQASWTFSGRVQILEEIILTSRPYSLELVDALTSSAIVTRVRREAYEIEAIRPSAAVLSVSSQLLVTEYDGYPPEEITTGAAVLSAQSNNIIIGPYEMEPDEIRPGAMVLSASSNDVVQDYEEYEPEEIEASATVLSATSTAV